MTKGLLGIELDAAFSFPPITVENLTVALPGIKFPVDLSGGVTRFRHRRGSLQAISLSARAVDLGAWAAPRLRRVLGEGTPEIRIAPIASGAVIGMRVGGAALAFDALVLPIEGDVRVVPWRARGFGLTAPPQVLALRVLSALAGSRGRVVSGAVVLAEAATQLGRHVLPGAGARAPSAHGMRWEALVSDGSTLRLAGSVDAPPPGLTDAAVRALETLEIVGDCDVLALEGDLDGARRGYLEALERAPRHPEISERIAWVDRAKGERAEGALSTLIEAIPAGFAGVLGGELLEAIGDREGARTALARGAHEEPFGPLSALVWLKVASMATEIDERFEALDHAVTRAPALDLPRWARLEARLDVADTRGAKADADHLEAAARGSEARLAVWIRAADAFLGRGFVAEAAALFERALRYAPERIESVLGLARSLRAAKQDRRALDLFARASAIADRTGARVPAVEIELAKALAEVAGDRPAAVARVRTIPESAFERFEARFLEGRWRAELGDLAGSSLAFGRLRDAVEIGAVDLGERAADVATFLFIAAQIEERERGDLLAAERDLGLALRLRPRDRGIASAFRRVAGARAAAVPKPRETEPVPEESDEQRVEELTHRLRANPRDHAVAMDLAGSLARLGRDLDLLSLASARIDEGTEAERREIAPYRREALGRLAGTARDAGRHHEAELYEAMLAEEPR